MLSSCGANRAERQMMMFYEAGELEEAGEQAERLLEIQEQKLGIEHPDTL